MLISREILEFFRQAAQAGKAVLISTHIMAEVALICDRAAVIHHGTIRAEGTLDALQEQVHRRRAGFRPLEIDRLLDAVGLGSVFRRAKLFQQISRCRLRECRDG